VTAVEQITGRGWQFVPVAVHQLSVQDIEELIRQRMLDANVHVIFTDLAAGSCTMAARRILRGMPDAVLVAGANLPMLLDFVFAEGREAPEAARHAAERGRTSITVHGGAA
jgi:PTS system N-acetylgalactosamine-specific IIA component